MYETQIPVLAYAFIGITTLVLSYVTVMDKEESGSSNGSSNGSSIIGSLPALPTLGPLTGPATAPATEPVKENVVVEPAKPNSGSILPNILPTQISNPLLQESDKPNLGIAKTGGKHKKTKRNRKKVYAQ